MTTSFDFRKCLKTGEKTKYFEHGKSLETGETTKSCLALPMEIDKPAGRKKNQFWAKYQKKMRLDILPNFLLKPFWIG